MRVVGSLTTIPGREKKLFKTLLSLKNQDYKLDEIYLNIPKYSKRLNKKYPKLSKKILKLVKIVKLKQDYGPICKILGALIMEKNKDTIIMTFDDDIIYDKTLVSKMIQYHIKFPNEALGSSGSFIAFRIPFYNSIINNKPNVNLILGLNIPEEGRYIDCLWGVSSVLYVRKFFKNYNDLIKYPLENENIFFNDDLMISGYLEKNNIKRRIVKNIPYYGKNNYKDDNFSISYSRINFIIRYEKAIEELRKEGFFKHIEHIDIINTLFGKIFMIVMVILIFIFIFLIFYYKLL